METTVSLRYFVSYCSNLDIDEAFKSVHQSIITKIKNYACEDYIALDATIKHSIKIFEC